MRRSVFWCACALIALAPVSARAQGPVPATAEGVVLTVGGAGNQLVARDYLSLTVYAGYGGMYRPGHWTPLDVVIRARVPRDLLEMAGDNLRGTLRIWVQTGVRLREIHTVDVDVPMQGEHRVSFLVLPEGDSVRVEFEPKFAGRALNALVGTGVDRIFGIVQMRQGPADALLVATFPRNEGALRRAATTMRAPRVFVAGVRPESVPGNPADWFGVDAVVLTLTELTQLPPAVQDGLLLWTRAGGRLVLTTDGAAPRLSRAVAEALPARLSLNRRVFADRALEEFGGAPLSEGQREFVASGQFEPRGEVLLTAGGGPLITRRILGSGAVTLVGTSLASPPFTDWEGLPGVWRKLLPAQVQEASAGAGLQDALLAAILGFRDLSATGLSSVLILFAVYAAFVGRGLAWLLGRDGRPELYWPAAGAVVGIVVVLTLANPAVLSMSEAAIQTVSLVRARSGSDVGRMETYASGTAHVNTRVDLVLAVQNGGFRTFPRQDAELTTTDRTREAIYDPLPTGREVLVGPTDAGLVLGASVLTDVPPLRFIREGGDRYTIRNETGDMLMSPGIALPDQFLLLEPLAPGRSITVDLGQDPRLRPWEEYQAMRRFAGLLPGVVDIVPPAKDVAGALRSTMITKRGATWFGADPTEPTLLAWWPFASAAAGNAARAPEFRGATLLAVLPEDA